MKRTEPLRISQIVENLLKERDMEDTMLRHRALSLWPTVVGPAINRLTVERRIAGSTLMLRIVSAPLRSELAMHRTLLLKNLNQALGKEVISDIKFF